MLCWKLARQLAEYSFGECLRIRFGRRTLNPLQSLSYAFHIAFDEGIEVYIMKNLKDEVTRE